MVKNLFSEDFKSLSNQFPREDVSSKVNELKKEIYLIKKNFESKIIKQSKTLLKSIHGNGYDSDDFKYKEKGVFGYIKNLSTGFIKLPGKRVMSCLEDNNNWINKSHHKKEEILSFIDNGFNSQLNKIIRVFDNEFLKYILFML